MRGGGLRKYGRRVDDATADRLVTLRSLFESARARAQDPTPEGRHAALILLDGACELALRHAADRKGGLRRLLMNVNATFIQGFSDTVAIADPVKAAALGRCSYRNFDIERL